MRLDDHAEADGMRVWLSQNELATLLDEAQGTEQQIAFKLGGQAGLRRDELTQVTYNDFRHAPQGFLRVWADYAKRDKYRETPIPDSLEETVIGEAIDRAGLPDDPVVNRAGNTVYRWVKRAADRLRVETGDDGWKFLSPHDLRRTWAGHLLWDCGVLPPVVMDWGGWEDWKTFRDNYLGEMSPAAAQRERSKAYGDAEASGPQIYDVPDHGQAVASSPYS